MVGSDNAVNWGLEADILHRNHLRGHKHNFGHGWSLFIQQRADMERIGVACHSRLECPELFHGRLLHRIQHDIDSYRRV